MLFLKIPRKLGEKTRQQLMAAGALDTGYPITSEGGHVYLPLVAGAKLPEPASRFEAVEREAEKRESGPKKLADALSAFLSPAELGQVVGSFDIIGDIAIMEIPDELESQEKKIGEALLKVHKNLRTVLKKLGPMEGEYRVRKVKVIAGEDRTETTYLENGVRMRLDVAKVYFSVRLAHERERIANLVRHGERVLVLFAGVGPFAFAIAKMRPDAEITAVEINPEAVRYMRENIALNRFANVEAVEADAHNAKLPAGSFDRVIMPLPKLAHEFLGAAFRAVKGGGTVHFYSIVGSADPFGEALEKAGKEAKKAGVSLSVASERVVKPYSPAMVQVVLDLVVRKNQ